MKIIFVLFFFSVSALVVTAQVTDNVPETVWKKSVTRMIDIGLKETAAGHDAGTAKADSSLMAMLTTNIKTAKLTAYSAFDNNFTTKLSPVDMDEMTVGDKVDTATITDPVTGKRETKIVREEFDLSSFHKFRLLEEWTFDPYTGKTEIQITGIAPAREIFEDDGVFRGLKNMLWVRYTDVQSIIARYDKGHPGNTFTGHIWADYFKNDSLPGTARKTKAARIIDMAPNNAKYYLKDEGADSSLVQVMITAIRYGTLTAYSRNDNTLTVKRSFAELKKSVFDDVDTVMVTDPITNTEKLKITRGTRDFSNMYKYRILEEWQLDEQQGKTEIQLTGIAPILRVCYNALDSASMFWVRYNDVRSTIAKYEQYHPDNTIAGHIWTDYFQSDVKPEMQK